MRRCSDASPAGLYDAKVNSFEAVERRRIIRWTNARLNEIISRHFAFSRMFQRIFFHLNYIFVSYDQCDQIGRFVNVLGGKILVKKLPKY